jgi:hypothetical protein
MKKIYYTKGNGLIIGKFYIPKTGVPFTSEMENDSRIKDLINKGILTVQEETVTQQQTESKNIVVVEETISASLPSEPEKPKIFEDPGQVTSSITEQESPIITEQQLPAVTPEIPFVSNKNTNPNEVAIVATSSENPVVKEAVSVNEAIDQDLKELKEEFEKLTTQEPSVPVQKKS